MTSPPISRTEDSSRPRALAIGALVTGIAYLAWRTTTLGSGGMLALSIPFLATELWALSHLALLSIQCWRVPPVVATPTPAPAGTVPRSDVIITAHRATPEEVERSLVGTTALVGCGRVIVIDATDRSDVRARTDRFHASYLVDPDVATSTAAVAHENANSALYVWMSAGQVAMPTLLRSLIERFDDPRVAVCQSAVGLMNVDSLVHLRGGRDEEALLRDVIGPGLDRLGSAPWHGPASMIRRTAIDEIGGVDRDDPAAVPRVLIRLHRAGWRSGFDAHGLIRSTAADDLDDYLARRRQHATEGLRVFRTPENPIVARGLKWQQRLVHVAEALSFGTGVRQLVQVAILAAVLLSGQLPFDAPLGLMLTLWGVPALLAVAARRDLARGSMAIGDWVRHGWRTVGADAGALWTSFGGRSRPDDSRDGNTSGLGALSRLRTLTVAVVALESILVLRGLTIVNAGLLPRLSTGERILVLSAAMLALAPMVDVLQVVVFRRQRRRNHRLQVDLPVTLGRVDATTVDLSPTGVGLILDSAPGVGATTPFSLTIPSIAGADQQVHGTAVVRAADADGTGRVRVGLEFVNLSDVARLALIAYCAIGHPLQHQSDVPSLSTPGQLEVPRKGTHQRSLQALSTAAVIAGFTVVAFGPGASAAFAEELPVDLVCTATAAGEPIPGAVIEHERGGVWQVLGASGTDGCLAIADGGDQDRFAVSHAGGRAESLTPVLDGSTLRLTLQDHRVAVFDTAGQPVEDAAVRYFTDTWYEASTTTAGEITISAVESPVSVEVTWQGGRLVQPFAPVTTVLLARVSADRDADVVEIDRGDGWEPFVDGMEILPGRFVVRLADGTLAKVEVPPGHELFVPSGLLARLDVVLPTPEPTAAPVAPTATEPTATPAEAEQPTSVEAEQNEPTPIAEPTTEEPTASPESAPVEPTPGPVESTPAAAPTEAPTAAETATETPVADEPPTPTVEPAP